RGVSSEKSDPSKNHGAVTPDTSTSPSQSAGKVAATNTRPDPRLPAGMNGVSTAANSGNSIESNQIIASKVFRRFHGQWKADFQPRQQTLPQQERAGR